MTDLVVAKEAAEADFERLCKIRRVDIDETDMSEKEVESLTKMRRAVVKAITRGELVVEENGVVIYTPPVPDAKPLSFRLAKASHLMATDNSQGKGNHHQMIATIASLTGWTANDLSKLDPPDYTFCAQLAGLFLA